ncbi:MAG: PorV/PorQ family protein [Spirochaetes bacterium]|nr:PorV/PorQ family protein [Spirochaetota bacterium]
MRILVIIFTIFLSAVCAYPYAGSEFLLLDTSVRAASLGGAYMGSFSGADGLHYNPASLNGTKNFSISLKNIRFIDDLSFKYISIAKDIYTIPLALSAGLVSMDDIPIYDKDENYTGDIKVYDFFGSLSGAYRFKYFYTGINIKYIYRKIDQYSASGVAFDVGILKQFDIPFLSLMGGNKKNNLTIGLVGRNLGTKIKFDQEADPLPTEIGMGLNAGIINNKLITVGLFADTSIILNDDISIRTGLEVGYKNTIFIRGGKSFIYNDTITAGLSLHLPLGGKVSTYFGYSLIMVEDFNNNHAVGVIIGL